MLPIYPAPPTTRMFVMPRPPITHRTALNSASLNCAARQRLTRGLRFDAPEYPEASAGLFWGSAGALIPYLAQRLSRHQIDLDGFQGDVLRLGYKEEVARRNRALSAA